MEVVEDTDAVELGLYRTPVLTVMSVEIGRASCKGKSVDLGGRRIIKKKKMKKKRKKKRSNKTEQEAHTHQKCT